MVQCLIHYSTANTGKRQAFMKWNVHSCTHSFKSLAQAKYFSLLSRYKEKKSEKEVKSLPWGSSRPSRGWQRSSTHVLWKKCPMSAAGTKSASWVTRDWTNQVTWSWPGKLRRHSRGRGHEGESEKTWGGYVWPKSVPSAEEPHPSRECPPACHRKTWQRAVLFRWYTVNSQKPFCLWAQFLPWSPNFNACKITAVIVWKYLGPPWGSDFDSHSQAEQKPNFQSSG